MLHLLYKLVPLAPMRKMRKRDFPATREAHVAKRTQKKLHSFQLKNICALESFCFSASQDSKQGNHETFSAYSQ